MAEKTKSKRVSMSKRKLSETAEGMELAAAEIGVEGAVQVVQGVEDLRIADDIATVGKAELVAGASDLTRAVDAEIVAERLATLSDVVATAGVVDVAEGAEMLATSDDVGVMSALVGLMSADDMAHGLELARISGEFLAVSEVVDLLQMPVLSIFLQDRGGRLHEMSVEQIRIAGSTRNLARAIAATGSKIATMGEDEIAEGVARMAFSEGMTQRSEELSEASLGFGVRGLTEVAEAQEIAKTAHEVAGVGIEEIAAGSSKLGASEQVEGMAEALEKKAK